MKRSLLHRRFVGLLSICLFSAAITFLAPGVFAHDLPDDSRSQSSPTQVIDGGQDSGTTEVLRSAAVIVRDKQLFTFYGTYDGLSPTERAQRTSTVLRQIVEKDDFEPLKLTTRETPNGTDIIYDGIRIASVSSDDARVLQSSTYKLATDFASKIRVELVQKREEATAGELAIGVGLSIAATLVLLITIALVSKATVIIVKNVQNWRGVKIKAIKIQEAELIGAHTVVDVLISLVNYAQILIMLLCVAIYVIQVLNFFPRTQGLASALAANALAPIHSGFDMTLMYLPSLFTLIFITLVTYAVISFARFLFNAISDKTIRFAGFDPDWAEPSYKLARFLIIAFALIIALPYVPGWESPAFKQVGLVLGVLVSFGSGAVVSNVMAGAVLTYTNAFKIGDRIKIGDCTGDVVEKTLFVTRIRTVKNEVVSIPNGQIMTSNVVNYSTMGLIGQLILHTTVTIGYEESYEKLEKLLIAAALATDGIVSEPAPFVLQTSLDDYYVTYEINAYTNHPSGFQQVYSDLHKNIQDKFNEAGVEIMSPQYICLRDGADTSIPLDYRGQDYVTPIFRVQQVDGAIAKMK